MITCPRRTDEGLRARSGGGLAPRWAAEYLGPPAARNGAPMRTFHLPLPDDLHDALRREAELAHRTATEVAKEALVAWLETRRQQRLAEDIQRFATATAGTEMDLDQNLEVAGVEGLLAEGES